MYIAFDVGGTYVKHGVLTKKGEIVEKGKYSTNCTNEDTFMEDMKRVVDDYCSRHDVKGIAMAMPGIINIDTGYMKEAGAILSLWGRNMKELLRGITDLPAEIENDANCVALAEKFNGNAVECEDFICMTIGTGIGGGIVIKDRIHHGWKFIGGEFGHMRINNENPEESLHDNCSTRGLINKYKTYMGIPEDVVVGGKEVFDTAETDKGAADILDRWFRNISIAIYNLSVMLNPQKILIGGGVSEREDFLVRIEYFLKKNENWENVGSEIGICKHKNDAGMLGALYHLLNKLQQKS